MDDKDWKQEIKSASVPTTHEMLKLRKNRAPASLLSKIIQHHCNPIKLEKIEKRAIMKFKALEVSEKVLGKVGNIFKVEGKGVKILDALFLGLDLKEVWTNEDKNINDIIYDYAKKCKEL